MLRHREIPGVSNHTTEIQKQVSTGQATDKKSSDSKPSKINSFMSRQLNLTPNPLASNKEGSKIINYDWLISEYADCSNAFML